MVPVSVSLGTNAVVDVRGCHLKKGMSEGVLTDVIRNRAGGIIVADGMRRVLLFFARQRCKIVERKAYAARLVRRRSC